MINHFSLRNIGRRGLILILCGLIWVSYGTAIINIPRIINSRINDDYGLVAALYKFFESPISGYPWILCGGAAITFGILRSRKSLVSHDHYGFNAILIPPIVWALFYFWAWMLSLLTNNEYGLSTGSYGFLVWGLFTGFILIISGWPDPSDLPPHPVIKEGEKV